MTDLSVLLKNVESLFQTQNLYQKPMVKIIPTLSSKKNKDGTITSKPLEDMLPYLKREEFYDNMIIKPLEE